MKTIELNLQEQAQINGGACVMPAGQAYDGKYADNGSDELAPIGADGSMIEPGVDYYTPGGQADDNTRL